MLSKQFCNYLQRSLLAHARVYVNIGMAWRTSIAKFLQYSSWREDHSCASIELLDILGNSIPSR